MGLFARKCIVIALCEIAIILSVLWVTVKFPNAPHWILLVLAIVALAAAVSVWNLPAWKRHGVPHDGRVIARKLARIPKRRTEAAEALFEAFGSRPPEFKQFPEEADRAWFEWLSAHWPDRARKFGMHTLGMSLRDIGREGAKQTGLRYARSRFPWWKRVWARLKW